MRNLNAIIVLLLVCCGSARADYCPTSEEWGGIRIESSENLYLQKEFDNPENFINSIERKYPLHYLFDGDPKTAWVFEGSKKTQKEKNDRDFNHGIGHWVAFAIPENCKDAELKIDSIGIINGYAKSEKIYKRNNRITEIEISYDDKAIKTVSLKQTTDMQFFAIPEITIKPWKSLKLIVKKITVGQDDDLCISEITLMHKGRKHEFAQPKYYIYSPGDECGCGESIFLMKPDGKLIDCVTPLISKENRLPDYIRPVISPDNRYMLLVNVFGEAFGVALFDIEKEGLVYFNLHLSAEFEKWLDDGAILKLLDTEGESRGRYKLDYKTLMLTPYNQEKEKKESVPAKDVKADDNKKSGVKFLVRADSRDALIKKARPDLYWEDEDAGQVLMWAEKLENGEYKFTLDCAYKYKNEENGKIEWVIYDLPAMPDMERSLKLSYVRTDLPNEGRGDGCSDFAVRLAHSDKHGDLYLFSFVSICSGATGNRGARGFIVYHTAEGKWILAAKNFETDNCWRMGWWGISWNNKIKVEWKTKPQNAPFIIDIIRNIIWYGNGLKSLSLLQYGKFSGTLPMKPKWDPFYVHFSEKYETLDSIIELMPIYHEYDDKSKVKIKEIIYALNPGLSEDKALEPDTAVFITDRAFQKDFDIKRLLKKIKNAKKHIKQLKK